MAKNPTPTLQVSVNMQRDHLWRLMYRNERYLEHASPTDLASRARDIVCNVTTLEYNGKIGLVEVKDGFYWMELFTHVLEEFALRKSDFPDRFMKNAAVPTPSFPREPRSVKLLKQLGPNLSDHFYIAKLGKSKYLESDFNSGRWRISPASSYAPSDPSLNMAQRDSELELSAYLPAQTKIRVWSGTTGAFKGEIMPAGNIKVTSQSVCDYYVSCLTKQLDLRLFDDFQADCAIIIHKPTEFATRVFAAAKKMLPTWNGGFGDITYVDPYRPPDMAIEIFRSKDFRFWYQREVRLAWLPSKQIEGKLDHLYLELGEIADLCEFVRI
jgi:hypothetical protein